VAFCKRLALCLTLPAIVLIDRTVRTPVGRGPFIFFPPQTFSFMSVTLPEFFLKEIFVSPCWTGCGFEFSGLLCVCSTLPVFFHTAPHVFFFAVRLPVTPALVPPLELGQLSLGHPVSEALSPSRAVPFADCFCTLIGKRTLFLSACLCWWFFFADRFFSIGAPVWVPPPFRQTPVPHRLRLEVA